MTVREGKGATGDDTWPAMESFDDADAPELISPARLLRYLDESESADAPGEGDPLPRITAMPEGISVDERRVGRAVAQWILHVRCDCGRRWFEAEAVDTATCPRCGVLVYVDIDARGSRR
jgi:hypothetical protein